MIYPEVSQFLKERLRTAFELEIVASGANNRAYHVSTNNGDFFLKAFSKHSPSSAKKLISEYRFSEYICNLDTNAYAAKPVDYCLDRLLGLYEFIDGEEITNCQLSEIQTALAFIDHINLSKNVSSANSLPVASDSPKTLYSFTDLVSKRIKRFNELNAEDEETKRCLAFVSVIEKHLKKIEHDLQFKNDKSWRSALNKTILSPSDFGFHNALRTKHGIQFFDFEYAGWDTPWKTLCDFFAQPAVPVSLDHIELFLNNPLMFEVRNNLDVLPTIYELTLLKWCLIMLNEFIPDTQRRRQFAWHGSCYSLQENDSSQFDIEKVKLAQRLKSQEYYEQIEGKLNTLRGIIKRVR
tara:strand:- start:20277 stop:21332 length:1056 start_codon:yes stop_codon:yes gene_type:complete